MSTNISPLAMTRGSSATMKLLGDGNWYASGPLRRWWGRHDYREADDGLPAESRVDRGTEVVV